MCVPPRQIRGALIKTAIDRGNVGCDAEYGFGFVQAEAAYDLLNAGGCEAGDTGMSPLGPGPQGGCAQRAVLKKHPLQLC